jgi:CHAD domain-containing protein
MKPEKVTARLRSFLKVEMARARRHLQTATHRNSGSAIHDARTTIKKLRAGLRLAADMAGPEVLETVAVPLREAAHRLGPLRDARVLSATARELTKRGETPLPAPPAPAAAALLREGRAQLRSAELALQRLLKIELDPKGGRNGLRRLYRKAQRAMPDAGRSDDESLHAWRRRTKDFYYCLVLIDADGRYTKKIKQLTGLLGDDHDLAFFNQHHASPAENKVHRALFKRLKRKRVRLQKKAFRLGRRLFEDRPRKMTGRLLKA